MGKVKGVDIPLDGAGGNNGLFWNPNTLDPKTYYRSYSRTAHYDNAIQRPNYEVITGHKVNKVLFDGKTATGVQFTSRDPGAKAVTVKARKEVIIAAGTVHTPQILQRSGIGPKGLLSQAKIPLLIDLPGVGQHFQDHIYLSVSYSCKCNLNIAVMARAMLTKRQSQTGTLLPRVSHKQETLPRPSRPTSAPG
jgi:choline dehydrogenase